jgi:hypothetical protein
MHRETTKALTDADRDAIATILAERILATAYSGQVEDLRELLPAWKKYGLYEKCIGIRRDLVDVTVGRSRLYEAFSKCPMPPYAPFSRDFVEGLIMASGAYVSGKDVFYPSIEFTGINRRKHILDLLSDSKVEFVSFNGRWSRYIARTKGIPYLLIKCGGDIEEQFAGMLAGSDVVKTPSGLALSMKPACARILNTLGVIYETVHDKRRRQCDRLIVSMFYLPLYVHQFPPSLFDYWHRLLPDKISKHTRAASIVAFIHWRLLIGNRRVSTRFLLPYLADEALARQIGVHSLKIRQFMEERKINFVDRRILDRCRRWMSTAENLGCCLVSEEGDDAISSNQ